MELIRDCGDLFSKIELRQGKGKGVKGIKGLTEIEIEFMVLPLDHLQAAAAVVVANKLRVLA
jgi:hypothetical protein